KLIPKNRPQFGSESATRLREVGIASNRGSARRGEYVLGPCTHRPSRHGSLLYRKSVRQPAREAAPHGMTGDWGEVVTRTPQGNVRLEQPLSNESRFPPSGVSPFVVNPSLTLSGISAMV